MKCPKCSYINPPQGTPDGKCNQCRYNLYLADPLNNKYFELASLNERLGARIVDWFIYAGTLTLSSLYLPKSVVTVGVILGVFYLLFSDAFNNGQSLGKTLMKISVVDAKSKKPCTLMRSFFRNITLQFLGIFDLIPIFSDKRQRLGDLLANTIVIKKN